MRDNKSNFTDFKLMREEIIRQFSLSIHSIHGPSHWSRVEKIGVRLCEQSGGDVLVVRLFSLFHDSRRMNDSHDPRHGARGAKLAEEMRGKMFELDETQFQKLKFACAFHTDGKVSDDPTIGTCWDSDRLDLGRCGIIPNPKMLSTETARERHTIAWAMELLRQAD